MSEPHTPVECDRHGESHATFVCVHLARDEQQGFRAYGDGSDPRPDAWCYECDLRRAIDGEWNEDNQSVPDIQLLCARCYDEARERNDVPRPSLEIDGWATGTLAQVLEATPEVVPPSRQTVENVPAGALAQMLFWIVGERDGDPYVQGERMWIRVRQNEDDRLVGVLESQPVMAGKLAPGQIVECAHEDVMNILIDVDAEPAPSCGPPRVRWVGGEKQICPCCGKEAEFLEPAFWRPDDVFAMSDAERGARVIDGDDLCGIQPEPGSTAERRSFIRCVLPVRLLDRDEETQWGLWVEVPEATARRVVKLWSDPDQANEPAFPARIANRVPGYPSTVGLYVGMRLTGPTTRPMLELAEDDPHPFAVECRHGVTTARVMEWLHGMDGHET